MHISFPLGKHPGSISNAIRGCGSALYRKLRSSRPWYQDLCEYYGVTPTQAIQLGTRANDRRPNLPGSATTQTVSGLTFEEIWAARKRTTPSDILVFWQDMGAWATFRQVVYHRHSSFKYLTGGVHPGSRICEYDAGVAPVSFWLVEHIRRVPLELTILDVPSEHLTFGSWRTQRRIRELRAPISLFVRQVHSGKLPLESVYDLITILEVYEHLHNPFEVTVHLCEHLRPGGLLWENYIVHDDPHASDLLVAQQERPQVFEYLQKHCELIEGSDPNAPEGMSGGIRCWRRL